MRAVLTAFAESDGRSVGDILEAIREDWTFQTPPASQAGPGATLSLMSLVAEMTGDRPRELQASIEAGLSERAPARPGPISRDDCFEAVQYYIRYGVLPYSMSLLHPDLTVADALDVLADLPLGSLQALSIDLGRDARLRAWRRVVQQVPRDRPDGPHWRSDRADRIARSTHLVAPDSAGHGGGGPAPRLRSGHRRPARRGRTDEPSQPAQGISVQEDVASLREDIGFLLEEARQGGARRRPYAAGRRHRA